MRRASLVICVALGVVCVPLQADGAAAAGTIPATGRAVAADSLAAESLLNSAKALVHAPATTPGRAGRLVALCRFADSLKRGDPQTHWLLAGIYESQDDQAGAAKSWRVWLSAHPDDYAATMRWLSAELTHRQSAGARLTLLASIFADRSRPTVLRAEAANQYAQILLGQGREAKARQSFLKAVRLDSHHPGALNGWLELQEKLTPADRADVMLRVLKGNPAAADVAWQLGALLDSVGLHDQAITFLDHAWRVARREQPEQLLHDLAAEYLNAMLNAGRYDTAIRTFADTFGSFKQSMDLQTLMIEAHRQLNETAEADRLIKSVRANYEKALKGSPSPELYHTLAWFYLVALPKPGLALVYAERAHKTRPQDPTVRRILGAVQLAYGDAKQKQEGQKQLQEMMDKDIYAAAILAERYYARGDTEAGKRAVLAGLKLSRSGPAARKLRALARRQQLTVPPPEGRDVLAAVVKTAGRDYLQMGRSPEKFVTVTIQPVARVVSPGEPVTVVATLTSASGARVSLGQEGLFNPVMSVRVAAWTGGTETVFENLPLAVWPAPRYLGGGKSVVCKVRLDVGGLREFLSVRCFEDLSLKVDGIVDPIVQDKKIRSSVPGLVVRSARITRESILGKFDRAAASEWPKAWKRTLAALRDDVKATSLRRRALAARRVASVLASLGGGPDGKVKVPQAMSGVVQRQELLTLVRALLGDRSAVIRAEMLAALAGVRLDEGILSLAGPLAVDPSPLVRFRLVELLGQARPALVEKLAKDPNEMVRMMAEAFTTPTTAPATTAPATSRPATTPVTTRAITGPATTTGPVGL